MLQGNYLAVAALKMQEHISYIDVLVQERHNSIVNALELHLTLTHQNCTSFSVNDFDPLEMHHVSPVDEFDPLMMTITNGKQWWFI